jgi:CO dehydrogenase/acetyl-CoA synthase beta subunit
MESARNVQTPDGRCVAEGSLKRIHVNQHVVRRNAKTGALEPPISVKTSVGTVACQAVAIDGPSTVVYSPDKPLSCGARIWVETRAAVTIR